VPRPVYSTRLFRAASFAGGPTVFFAAPAGFVTVVKCIHIVTGSTLAVAHAWVEDDEGGKLAMLFGTGTPNADPISHLEYGEWVLEAGETLSPATTAPTIADFYVSGYLLTVP